MKPVRLIGLSVLLLLPLLARAAASPFEGRWRLDPARSSPLDGWTAWDLVISIDGGDLGSNRGCGQEGRVQLT